MKPMFSYDEFLRCDSQNFDTVSKWVRLQRHELQIITPEVMFAHLAGSYKLVLRLLECGIHLHAQLPAPRVSSCACSRSLRARARCAFVR